MRSTTTIQPPTTHSSSSSRRPCTSLVEELQHTSQCSLPAARAATRLNSVAAAGSLRRLPARRPPRSEAHSRSTMCRRPCSSSTATEGRFSVNRHHSNVNTGLLIRTAAAGTSDHNDTNDKSHGAENVVKFSWVVAIASVKFSSKSELSPRIFGRLKFSAPFE